jgi:hypothetical protein
MDMNPFAELQQYQLGSSLMGQPPVSTPAVQPQVSQLPMGQMPAAAAAPAQAPVQDMQGRIAGWRNALEELRSNPAASLMLLQFGLSMTAGRGGPGAVGDAFGAVGGMGELQSKDAQQQLQNQLAQRKVAVEEGQLEAQRPMWAAQAQRYNQLAAGGSGGAAGGAGSLISDMEQLEQYFFQKHYKDYVDTHQGPPSETDLGQLKVQAREDAMYARLGRNKVEPTPGRQYADPTVSLLIQQRDGYPPGSQDFNILNTEISKRLGVGTGPSVGSAKEEFFGRVAGLGAFPNSGQPGAATPTQAPKPASNLGDIRNTDVGRSMNPKMVVRSLQDGIPFMRPSTIDQWISQGYDVRPLLEAVIATDTPNNRTLEYGERRIVQDKLKSLR